MPAFTRKGVAVEAFRWDGRIAPEEWPDWLSWPYNKEEEEVKIRPTKKDDVYTMEINRKQGTDQAHEGDWIVLEPSGERRVYAPMHFKSQFEEDGGESVATSALQDLIEEVRRDKAACNQTALTAIFNELKRTGVNMGIDVNGAWWNTEKYEPEDE